MGKNKRLRIVKTGELQQQSVEVEHRIEQHSTISEANDSVQQFDDGPQKKVRRHTRKQAIWDLESDEQIEVYFNELGQPVGDEGNELTSFLGTLVKMSNHLSIEHLDWRKVSNDKKEDLWRLVKAESEMKRKIRKKFKEPHVTGTKSFARLVHEETKKNNGVRPSRGKTYILARTRENGDIVNEVAAEVVGKLKNLEHGFTSSTDVENLDWTNDDLAKVKGPEKRGRVSCLGKVVLPKEKGSCFSQDPQVPVLKARINELEDKMKEMGESKERQDAETKELKDRREAMMRFMAVIKEQLPNANLSNIFVRNTQAANDSSSVYDHPTSSHASHNRS